MDDVLSQAAASSQAVKRQGASISRSADNFLNYVSRVPGVNTLIQRIRSRKTRDSTVIALTIAACVCFTLWYILSSSAPTQQ